jgi:hypothetical protein
MINFAGKSNVTLRGAGPDQTILQFTSSAPNGCGGPNADVCLLGSFNWSGGPQHTTTWTAGYAPGATQITLGNTAGLSVGQLLILDQDNDIDDTGQVFVCDNIAGQGSVTCSSDSSSTSSSPGRNCSRAGTVSGCTGQTMDRNQQEYKLVTAINGNVVTISPGLYMPNWRGAKNPGAFWATATINMSGIENLTLDHTASAPNMMSGVMFFDAYQCWVKNVKSLVGNRNHVWVQYSAGIVIRDSYFWGTLNSATLSYGVEPWQSGDLLVENNIFQHVVTPILIGNTTGSVFAYNFGIDNTTFSSNPLWQMPGPPWAHDAGTSMNLVEGNEGTGFILDDIHGSNNFFTAFRNQFTGKQVGRTQQTVPIIFQSHSRYVNLIGNVLGTPGYHTNYQSNSPTSTSCDTSVYNLAWSGPQCTNIASIPADPLVISTIMRWGNYDVAHATAQWSASEVPSGLSQFANPVPGNQNIPPSFYLASKASWWGTVPWPAVGPDVTGGTDPTGHAFAIPAQVCYNNTPKDSNAVLTFNANTCYGQAPTTPPAPPTSLLVSIH